MNPVDRKAAEDPATAFLLAYDGALAAGLPLPEPEPTLTHLDHDAAAELRQARVGLRLLELVWPRSRSATEPGPEDAPSASGGPPSGPEAPDPLSPHTLAALAEHLPRRLRIAGYKIV